jgi:hypothetical protein
MKDSPCFSFRHLLLLTGLCTAVLSLFGCASSGNNFDESKISAIKKGVTTETDLVQWFGEPQNRSVNSESIVSLNWTYAEARVKAESFIPYAGAFMGGGKSKVKSLQVQIADNKVTGFTYTGGGSESRNMTQSTPK